jgi:hypothetical protein
LREGSAMDSYDGVATPLGPLPIQFFLDALDAPDDAREGAQKIFPWWSVTSIRSSGSTRFAQCLGRKSSGAALALHGKARSRRSAECWRTLARDP